MRIVDRFMLCACLAAGLVFCVSAAGFAIVELQAQDSESHATSLEELEELGAGARPVGEEVTPPELVTRVQPEYPEEMRAARATGRVILQAVIDGKGVVSAVAVLRGSGHMPLDNAAIDAVRQWRYQPAMMEGSPVKVTFTVVVNFTLADNEPS